MRSFKEILEIRLVDLLRSAQENDGRSISTFGPEPSLLPESVYPHDLTLSELRYFPRYLCDATIFGLGRLPDHFMYWGWTAMFTVGHPSAGHKDVWPFTTVEHRLPWAMFMRLRNYVDLITTTEWYSVEQLERDDPPLYRESIAERKLNQLFQFRNIEQINTTVGFSLFEALLRRHCKQVNREGRFNPHDPEKYPYTAGNLLSYNEEIELWMNHNREPATYNCLSDLNDLSKPSNPFPSYSDVLPKIIDGRLYEKFNDDFFTILKGVRHSDLHGGERADTPMWDNVDLIFATILMNLCCLVFWDGIESAEFKRRSEAIRSRYQMRNPSAGLAGELWEQYPWYCD